MFPQAPMYGEAKSLSTPRPTRNWEWELTGSILLVAKMILLSVLAEVCNEMHTNDRFALG